MDGVSSTFRRRGPRATGSAPRASATLALALIGAALAVASPGAAADAEVARVLGLSDDAAWGEYLAGECASCHAAGAPAGAEVPRIHGADAARLVRALLDYRGGVRTNTTMVNVARALGDEEIAALAHHLSGAGGEGDEAAGVPAPEAPAADE